MTICDDGLGFDTKQHFNGIGLESMRERAESFKGDFQIESEISKGSKIVITIPIEAKIE
jgi:signal transduction histidine kinase